MPFSLFELLIVAVVGSIVLRSACWLFNRFTGKRDGSTSLEEIPIAKEVDYDRSVPATDFDRPFSSPTTPLTAAYSDPEPGQDAVPLPSYRSAFAICFMASIAYVLLSVGLSNSLGMRSLLNLLLLLSLFGVFVLLVKSILPTSFPKAAGVTGIFFIVGLVFVCSIVGMASIAFFLFQNN